MRTGQPWRAGSHRRASNCWTQPAVAWQSDSRCLSRMSTACWSSCIARLNARLDRQVGGSSIPRAPVSSLVRRFPWLEAAALTLVAIATSVQLFVPPIVGLADNRDYGRVMAQIGVDYCHGAESTV